MNGSFEIREYAENDRSPYRDWFDGLDDVTALRVKRYLRRLEAGNFGAVKSLQEGVFEVRMDFGPGWRVYYGREGRTDHHFAWWRKQTTAGRRYCRRRGAMEAIQTNQNIK